MHQSPHNTHRPARRLRALLFLNAALLVLLGAVTFSAPAEAQAQARARGEFMMASGRAPGTNAGVVYIVDTVNQDMMVVAYNQNTRQLDGVAYRNLGADAAAVARGQHQPAR